MHSYATYMHACNQFNKLWLAWAHTVYDKSYYIILQSRILPSPSYTFHFMFCSFFCCGCCCCFAFYSKMLYLCSLLNFVNRSFWHGTVFAVYCVVRISWILFRYCFYFRFILNGAVCCPRWLQSIPTPKQFEERIEAKCRSSTDMLMMRVNT